MNIKHLRESGNVRESAGMIPIVTLVTKQNERRRWHAVEEQLKEKKAEFEE